MRALSPLVDVFLSHGNHVEIIVGIDRGGTDRNAIRFLRALKKAYINQVDVSVFHAPARNSIFHPKLYIMETKSSVNFVVGSANLTVGGLASNFESMLLYENIDKGLPVAKAVMSIWEMFSSPEPPLKKSFLKALTKDVAADLIRKLPRRSREEKLELYEAPEDIWKPLSRITFPHTVKIKPRKREGMIRQVQGFLLMDVLRETRRTQMQIPLRVVEDFFQVQRGENATIHVSLITDEGLSQPINRPIVLSGGVAMGRLMRRLEMPLIKGLERPLAVLFVRLTGKNRFAFLLFPRETPDYKRMSQLLARHGQQGKAARRYRIGSVGDRIWKPLSGFLEEG
jgi:hypothetical protein